jgi:hypothetical protein
MGTAESSIVASPISSDGDGNVGTRLSVVGVPNLFATDAPGHPLLRAESFAHALGADSPLNAAPLAEVHRSRRYITRACAGGAASFGS